MTDNVNHPSHYTDGKIEVIDFIEDKGLNFHRGNAVKYISRAGKKDPSKEIEDLEKAVWYLRREIERLRREKESQGQNGTKWDKMGQGWTKWDKDGQNGTRMDKMIKGKIPCAHKQCSNYSESGCELWNECPVFQADNVTPKPASRSWRRKSMKKLTSHDVSDLMMFATQKDCKSLKEMILANPDAPLLIFVGDEANSGEYQYESCDAGLAALKELTLYDGQWLDRNDYGEQLEDDLADEEEYSSLSDEEFEAKIDEIVEETAFIRAIVVYVG